MKERLKMKITTIRQQALIPAGELRLPCPVCEREVGMVTYDAAIRILGRDPEAVSEMVAAHSVRTISGSILVCKDSLFAK